MTAASLQTARRVSAALGACALTGSLLVILGWLIESPRLTDWDGHGISMQPNTAIAVALAAGALLLLAFDRTRASAAAASVCSLIGIGTLLEHLLRVDLGIDRLILDKAWGKSATVAAGRMGPPASASFALLGAAIFIAAARKRTVGRGGNRAAASFLGLTTAAIALPAIAGHFYGASELYAIPQLTGVAFPTASLILILSLGLLAGVPEREPARSFFDAGGAGILARRALPFIVVLPLFLGWLRLEVQRTGFVDTEMAVALLVVSLVLMLCAVLWRGVTTVRARERDFQAAEEALREADRRKDDFLATLSHELRNPLGAITSAVALIRRGGAPGTAVQISGEIIERQTAYLTRLVEDLLEVSRIARGKIALETRRFSVADAARLAIETSRPMIEARGQRLIVSMPPSPVAILGDPTRLAQAIGNLLHNASKYSDHGGRIWLDVELDGADAVIRVRDEGVGIEPEIRGLIFDPFVQGYLRPPADPSHRGLGLGLAVVRTIAQLHGGDVAISSHAPGPGSEFVLRIPALAPDATLPIAPETSRPTQSPARRASLRILVVDDNVDSARGLAALLDLEGHDVRISHDGVRAVADAATFFPEVVLLDIGLPGIDGYEVARQIRSTPGLGAMRLIAVTGFGQEEDRRRSREAGFDDHVLKPVRPDTLIELIESAGVPRGTA